MKPPAEVKALGGDRLEDLHSYLDEAIAAGIDGAILIMHRGHGFRAIARGGSTPESRLMIYQQLSTLEVHYRLGVGDGDGT